MNTGDTVDHNYRPSRLLLWLEGRALYDAAGMLPLLAFQQRLHAFLPRSDGHPVLVLPGFLAGTRSTAPLRSFLRDQGYRAHCWKQGYNTGYSAAVHRRMRQRVEELAERYGRKVSLVGWSLGGVFARELARESPDIVRLVCTLGSPFRGHPSATHAHGLFDLVSAVRYADLPGRMIRDMPTPPPVPSSALYTRGDGIVAWQSTIEVSDRADVENIHVGGAHFGLGFNPRALYAIADRLAQPEGEWRPFAPPSWLAPFYRSWYPDWLVNGHADPLRV